MRLPLKYDDIAPRDRKFVRMEYACRQKGQCFFCGEDLSGDPSEDVKRVRVNWSLFPNGKGFLRYPVHLQHCHKSGMTEGAVHALCNAVWWQRFQR